MRCARRAAERHFLQQALTRAGSVEALARSLGVSPRVLARRSGAPIKPSTRRKRAP
jgi:transcriptional regulator GlxA family with amidase domain